MDAQLNLPVTFKFVQEYKRWKGTSSQVFTFDNRRLDETTSQWETQIFSPGLTITIVEQTKSLLGIRWKTAEGLRFTTDELRNLMGLGIIEHVPNVKLLSGKQETPRT